VSAAVDARRAEAQDPHASRPPHVWALVCERTGDNAQILALAEALGWPYEVKHLAYRRFGRLSDVLRGANLRGIACRRSSPLEPPWPDLLISASMRNEPVCRWIQARSAGRTRYVHVGKPWGRLEGFDLVITAPEYHSLPQLPNVLHNASSLHAVTPDRLEAEARLWASSVETLPRPLVAVLVGGYAGPYVLDRLNAERLGREASAFAARRGGSLLVTTSARTSRAAVAGLRAGLGVPNVLFCWDRDVRSNPYFGFLALAESIIVTCDSTSMLAEACATQKPVYIFDLAKTEAEDRQPSHWLRRCNAQRLRALLYRQVMLRVAPRNVRREIAAVHEALLSSGRAAWLGEALPKPSLQPLDDMPRALARVRALLRDGSDAGVAAAPSARTEEMRPRWMGASTCPAPPTGSRGGGVYLGGP
jgi:mitochondrial fission protein ELM1